ncbi:ATP-binding protein [Streptomyces sp. NPDC060194]|uniref:ATP-binding protein n=1 Tax=Streptomyces sp. NPDC060194 TaxID=3347069 RepID=UPI00364C9D31
MSEEPHVVVMDSDRSEQQSDSAAARTLAADFVRRHCPWADLEAVLLVVSELVTNAVRHTAGWWRLQMWAHQGELVIELDDTSHELPVARTPDFAGGGGFGWHMVQRLAARVEVLAMGTGKRIKATWLAPMAAVPA